MCQAIQKAPDSFAKARQILKEILDAKIQAGEPQESIKQSESLLQKSRAGCLSLFNNLHLSVINQTKLLLQKSRAGYLDQL